MLHDRREYGCADDFSLIRTQRLAVLRPSNLCRWVPDPRPTDFVRARV